MKKLFLVVTMLLMVSLTYAQSNVTTVDQTGSSNNAQVTQTGSSNAADVDQFGTNLGVVNQNGSGNDVDLDQGASGANVTNSGSNGSGDWKYGAFIDQLGDENDAILDMNSSSNGASIYQEGDYNWAKQELNAPISKTTNWARMGLDIDQVGDNNWANQKTVYSFGCYGVQGMMIAQTGDFNIADQLSIGGMANVTEITQIGNNNNNPSQSGNTYDVSATTLTDPLLLPYAHKPAGTFTQYTYQRLGTTHMFVSGDDNNTYQYQEYTVWSVSGDNDATMDVYGSRNDAAQGQLGEYNDSDIDISGDDNIVTTSQFGDSNIATIQLLNASSNCVAGIEQTGDSHTSSIQQDGANNFAKVIQQNTP